MEDEADGQIETEGKSEKGHDWIGVGFEESVREDDFD